MKLCLVLDIPGHEIAGIRDGSVRRVSKSFLCLQAFVNYPSVIPFEYSKCYISNSRTCIVLKFFIWKFAYINGLTFASLFSFRSDSLCVLASFAYLD